MTNGLLLEMIRLPHGHLLLLPAAQLLEVFEKADPHQHQTQGLRML